MIDPEFLIIIEPDFSVQNENRIIIHQKVPLIHVQSMIDRQDQRNLVIAFAMFYAQNPQNSLEDGQKDIRGPSSSLGGASGPGISQGPGAAGKQSMMSGNTPAYSHKELLLYFENTSKCNYLKNMLDHTKKTFKQQ